MIVERYRAELIRFAARQSASAAAAEDIVQETLTRALAALHSGAEVRHVRAWLYQITRHALWRARPAPHRIVGDAEPSTEPLEDLVERRADLPLALAEVADLRDHRRLGRAHPSSPGSAWQEVESVPAFAHHENHLHDDAHQLERLAAPRSATRTGGGHRDSAAATRGQDLVSAPFVP
ncbi:MAG TPA: sigma factor, partial [Solirubrobacteraceae bacterium]|nr:sigma factor [Solirubrobacteraceae bacterium]